VAVLGAALIACAAAAASAAAPKSPRLPGTAAGRALVQHALISRSSLGAGFSESPAPHSLPDLTCPAFHPGLPGVIKTGTAISPTFSGGGGGPFISQSAYAFATAAQQAEVWHKVIARGLLGCVRASLEAGSTRRVTLRATKADLMSAPPVTRQVAGYRVRGTASTTGQLLDVYLDMLVVGRGPVITTISITSFSDPASSAFEAKLARAALRRLPRR
jgi:hypothetical protein